MEKEYNLPEESPNSKNEIEDPAIAYGKKQVTNIPCQYTIEELRQRVDQAAREIREGNFLTDDELDDFVLK